MGQIAETTRGHNVGLLLLSLALVACQAAEPGGEEDAGKPVAAAPEAPEAAAPADANGYTVVDVTDGGTITGDVRFDGKVPGARTVVVTDDVEACGNSQRIQLLQVERGLLADVVVSLTDITQGAALAEPSSPPALDQAGCQFAPHVLLVGAGSPVHILNSDPLTHNVHTVSFENRAINRAQPKELRQIETSFRVPEKVIVKCDIHEWMGAWIVVADHPYYAITDGKGGFTLENVPPGTYTMEMWHETLGTASQTVTVTANETTNVTLTMAEG